MEIVRCTRTLKIDFFLNFEGNLEIELNVEKKVTYERYFCNLALCNLVRGYLSDGNPDDHDALQRISSKILKQPQN